MVCAIYLIVEELERKSNLGADGRIRTDDLLFTKELLYR